LIFRAKVFNEQKFLDEIIKLYSILRVMKKEKVLSDIYSCLTDNEKG